MVINVNKISEKGFSLKDSVDIDGNLLTDRESHFLEKLSYQIFLQREGTRIKARGSIRTTISLPCIRCLDAFDLKINSGFDVILFPAEQVEAHHSASLHSDEMEYIFFTGDQIDVQKILVEQINLFIPLYPICRPTCKGICPNCGTNLNYGECPCDPPHTEIKFSFDKTKR